MNNFLAFLLLLLASKFDVFSCEFESELIKMFTIMDELNQKISNRKYQCIDLESLYIRYKAFKKATENINV